MNGCQGAWLGLGMVVRASQYGETQQQRWHGTRGMAAVRVRVMGRVRVKVRAIIGHGAIRRPCVGKNR